MDELLVWCAAHLQKYDVRVAFLVASGVVRVWVQMDQRGKRRVPLCDASGGKLAGEAKLAGRSAIEALESAAAELLALLERLKLEVEGGQRLL